MGKIRHCGADISYRWFDACARRIGSDGWETRRFENTPSGHEQLIGWLRRGKYQARVVLEATGNYGLELALALAEAEGIEVMVVNPRAARHFAEAKLQRARTDKVSAQVLCDYAERMPFEPWRPPSAERLGVRAIGRRMVALRQMCNDEKNRLHAQVVCGKSATGLVVEDLKAHIEHLQALIQALESQARVVMAQDRWLHGAYERLQTICGIGQRSALLIVAELCCLPDGLDARQWVAFAGLDPRTDTSGSSVRRPSRISRMGSVYLRSALFMPALVAMRHDPYVRRFADRLLTKGKVRIVVVVAVMRKLVHGIYGMIKNSTDFDSKKLFPDLISGQPTGESDTGRSDQAEADAITAPQRRAQDGSRARAPRKGRTRRSEPLSHPSTTLRSSNGVEAPT